MLSVSALWLFLQNYYLQTTKLSPVPGSVLMEPTLYTWNARYLGLIASVSSWKWWVWYSSSISILIKEIRDDGNVSVMQKLEISSRDIREYMKYESALHRNKLLDYQLNTDSTNWQGLCRLCTGDARYWAIVSSLKEKLNSSLSWDKHLILRFLSWG